MASFDPYFSGTKVACLDDPGCANDGAGELAFGTIDSFLVWQFAMDRRTSPMSAMPATLLMNLETLDWDVSCSTV